MRLKIGKYLRVENCFVKENVIGKFKIKILQFLKVLYI